MSFDLAVWKNNDNRVPSDSEAAESYVEYAGQSHRSEDYFSLKPVCFLALAQLEAWAQTIEGLSPASEESPSRRTCSACVSFKPE